MRFDAMADPSIEYGPNALIGPLNMDGSGIAAGMKVGAGLAGLLQPNGFVEVPEASVVSVSRALQVSVSSLAAA